MSNRITPKGICVTQGDSLPIVLDFHQDIEDALIRMQVRDETGTVRINKEVREHLNPRHGHSLVKLTPEDTSLPIGKYVVDMTITFNEGTHYTFYPARVGETAFFHIVSK